MVFVVDVVASACGLMTLDALKSAVTAAGAVTGSIYSTAAVVRVKELRYLKVPVDIKLPDVPITRHRTIASHNHDVLTNEFVGVITGVDNNGLALPLLSEPFPHNKLIV